MVGVTSEQQREDVKRTVPSNDDDPIESGEHRAAYNLRGRWLATGVVAIAVLGVGAFFLGRSDAPQVNTTGASSTTTNSTTRSPVTSGPAPPTASTTSVPPPTKTPSTTVPPSPIVTTYAFPIAPAAAATPSSSHHDYPASDIFAPCGSAVVATTSGTIQEVTLVDEWSSENDLPELRGGLSYSIVGDDGVRYYGSHLQAIDASVRPGSRVAAGDRIGTVGESGNAAGTGCHLHFGISEPCGPGDVLRRRGEIWPQEYLRAWKLGEHRSPLPETQLRSC